jgi:hypothetical protein
MSANATTKQITFSQFNEAVKGSRGFQLFSASNPKVEKGEKAGYQTFILHLAPASLSGWNTCPMATIGCKAACLNTAGRGGIMGGHGILTADDVAKGLRNTIQNARINRTRLFFSDRTAFMVLLVKEIEKAIRLAKRNGLVPVFRLNGTSDIRWETIRVPLTPRNHQTFDNVMAMFPDVQFYDYTKIANRKNVPANYSLTFSLADGNEAQASEALANGVNVAVVFRDLDTVNRYITAGRYGVNPIARGDDTDLRFLDPKGEFGTIIALYAKGNAKRDTSGFVRD